MIPTTPTLPRTKDFIGHLGGKRARTDAPTRRAQSRHFGGQHAPAAPRERRRPQRTICPLIMCVGCFQPAPQSPCAACKAQGNPPTPPPPPSSPSLRKEPQTITMGPLPTPSSEHRCPQCKRLEHQCICGEIGGDDDDWDDMSLMEIDHLDLLRALHEGQTTVKPHYKRVEFEGRMSKLSQCSIIRWLEQRGGTSSNPFNCTLQRGDLTIKITCYGWGAKTNIELVDFSPPPTAMPVRSASPLLVLQGGAA